MEEPAPSATQTDIFDSLSPSSKPEEGWPSLSGAAGSIQPSRSAPPVPSRRPAQIMKEVSPQNHVGNGEKYAQCFQGGRVLSISELVQEVQPKVASFVVTDLKTRRLVGLGVETFEELLKAAGIPAKYYCRRSFATCDVLLPSEELSVGLAGDGITSEHFRLQPECLGQRGVKITVCSVPMQMNGEVLAAFLYEHGKVEDAVGARSSSGTAHGDCFFTVCLSKRGFRAVPRALECEGQVVAVIVERRVPQCWFCEQLGRFSRSCPQEAGKPPTSPPPRSPPLTTTTTTIITTTTAAATTRPNTETGDHPNKGEEGWTQVTRGRKKKSPLKAQINEATTGIPGKKSKKNNPKTMSPIKITSQKKKEEKKQQPTENPENMDVSVNLKRRRDCGDSVTEAEEKPLKKQQCPNQRSNHNPSHNRRKKQN